jgi:hypothetical protein
MLTITLSALASAAPVDREEVAAHTAHVLPWGEVMVGTSGVHAGILPRVQVGARPLLTALGLPSGSLRIAAVDTAPFDLAVVANGAAGTWPGTQLTVFGAGALGSLDIDRFALHAGASHTRIHAEGVPERSPWWVPVGDEDPLATMSTGAGGGVVPVVHGGNTTLRGAGEVHLVGPLSILAQGARTWTTVGASVAGDLPPELRELSPAIGLEGIWTASASLKLELGRVHLRGGAGASNLPFAWLTQAAAAHVRIGGASAARLEREAHGVDGDGVADL